MLFELENDTMNWFKGESAWVTCGACIDQTSQAGTPLLPSIWSTGVVWASMVHETKNFNGARMWRTEQNRKRMLGFMVTARGLHWLILNELHLNFEKLLLFQSGKQIGTRVMKLYDRGLALCVSSMATVAMLMIKTKILFTELLKQVYVIVTI